MLRDFQCDLLDQRRIIRISLRAIDAFRDWPALLGTETSVGCQVIRPRILRTMVGTEFGHAHSFGTNSFPDDEAGTGRNSWPQGTITLSEESPALGRSGVFLGRYAVTNHSPKMVFGTIATTECYSRLGA
jgi:hypothetical protein